MREQVGQPVAAWGEPSDEDLVRRLARGEHEAIGPLYSRYASFLFNLAAKSLDWAVAEEIVQDVFLAMWRRAATFDPDRGPVRPWLLQIAHHRILNELRARSRQPQVERDPDGVRLMELPDPDPDPADSVAQAEDRGIVQSAVDRLPASQRQAVGLAFFGGLSHEQVADRLDLPLGTAKSRIRAGLRTLRANLALLTAVLIVALAGVIGVLAVRVHTEQAAHERDERALRLVTSSQTSALRMSAAPGVPPEVHGTYRGQAGLPMAVVTLSHVVPPPSGQVYQLWVRHGDVWTSLGTARPGPDGRAIVIAEGPALATLPDALQVTLEPAGGSVQPSGPALMEWRPEGL